MTEEDGTTIITGGPQKKNDDGNNDNNNEIMNKIKIKNLHETFNLKTEEMKKNVDEKEEQEQAAAKTDHEPTTSSSSSSSSNKTKKEKNKTKKNKQPLQPQQGRLYDSKYAEKPGGIKVDEMYYGLRMAHLSCTDDTENRRTLNNTMSANSLEALKLIVGEDDVTKPLSTLLKNHFDLNLDYWIDESGWLRGRPVDTQGFIASNDDTIVLSYQFTTTKLDWLTNIWFMSSEWEPDVDEQIGHAGCCSSIDGRFTRTFFPSRGKPRVHTGFYNNFIYTIPHIRKYIINKLLDEKDTTPKKVYICGCSLGGAIATMAYCFLLQELENKLSDPNFMNHKLISVTAGAPRSCDPFMINTVMERIMKLSKPLDRTVNYRLVYNHDLVSCVPFGSKMYYHLDKLIYITEDGDIIVNPNMKPVCGFKEFREVYTKLRSKNTKYSSGFDKLESTRKTTIQDDDNDCCGNSGEDKDNCSTTSSSMTPFEKQCATQPGPIVDHMPYWYLKNIKTLKDKVDAGLV